MIKNRLILGLLILCSFVSISQQINYNDFINNVILYNPLSKKASNETKYGELKYKSARGNYDPIINGDYNQKQFSGSNYYSLLSSEIKQPIFTSQYLKLGYDYSVGNYVNPETTTPPKGIGFVGVEVGLLQGLFIDKRRAEVLKAKQYLTYYNAEKNNQLNQLLYDASLKYVDWLFVTKQINLNNYFLKLSQERYKGVKELAAIGEKAPIDSIEAAILLQSRLLDVKSTIIENQKIENELAIFNINNDNSTASYSKFNSNDSLDLFFNKIITVKSISYTDSISSNPLLLKYNALQNILKIENRLKKEMIKPVLNVKYNFLYNNTTNNVNFSPNNYKWGLNMSFPLLLRSATNDYKMSKVITNTNELEISNKTNEFNLKLNALKQNSLMLSQQITIAERNVRYSKQLVEAEKEKFNNGESTLFLLNTRENKWQEFEIKLSEYKLKYIKTILSIIYINGNLEYKL